MWGVRTSDKHTSLTYKGKMKAQNRVPFSDRSQFMVMMVMFFLKAVKGLGSFCLHVRKSVIARVSLIAFHLGF